MARKKEVKPMVATEKETKFVRLELSESEHRELRVLAAQNGQSMAAFCRALVREALVGRKPKGAR
jgi:plasmid stability protein